MKCTPHQLDAFLSRREKLAARLKTIGSLIAGDDVELHSIASASSGHSLLDFCLDVAHAYAVYGGTSYILDTASYLAQYDDVPSLESYMESVAKNDEGLYDPADVELCSHVLEHGEAPQDASAREQAAIAALIYCTVSALACCPHHTATIRHLRGNLALHAAREERARERHRVEHPGEPGIPRRSVLDRSEVEHAREGHAPWADYITIHHLDLHSTDEEVSYLSNLAEVVRFLDAARDEAAQDSPQPLERDTEPRLDEEDETRLDGMGRLMLSRLPDPDEYRSQLDLLMDACSKGSGLAIDSGMLLDSLNIVLEQWGASMYTKDELFYPALLQLSKVEALLARGATRR